MSKHKALYNSSRWKRRRARQLQEEPTCRFCREAKTITPATVVDHKTPHKGDECLFFDDSNLQSLCKLHHDATKQRQERSGVETGGDEHGYPTSTAHHWSVGNGSD